MIRNILLDLDDTILDFRKAEHAALEKTLRHFGLEPTEKVLSRYSVINQEQWQLLELGKLTRPQVKVRRYALLFEEFGLSLSPEETAAYYESRLGVGHWFMPGAEELLEALYGKYRLYMVSNGDPKVQAGRIESAGIARYFEEMFVSQDIGFEKPSVKFFDTCFERIAEFRKEETVIVGDSLTADIKGGVNAGITTVWYNARGKELRGVTPDYTVTRLSELPELLEKLG